MSVDVYVYLFLCESFFSFLPLRLLFSLSLVLGYRFANAETGLRNDNVIIG